jgi:hypothetical protein
MIGKEPYDSGGVAMSWEDQGRQYHMWFGHGTAPGKSSTGGADPSVTGKSTADRVQALAYGAIALLPAAQRRQAEAQYRNGTLPRLTAAMSAWMRGTRLDQATFADRFFGRSADDHVVRSLHSAALDAATATSQADIREAAGKLAEAMQAVGLYQWPSFVADAEERARDPATVAAIEKSRQPPDPGRDAIQPVYPVETGLGIGAAGIIGGAAAAARAVGGAILKQVLPKNRSPTGDTAANAAKPENIVRNTGKKAEPPNPSLPAKPDDLLAQGWKETSHPGAAELGHRTFENPKTGEIVRFDKGRPGGPRFEGKDHYHRLNPNRTGKRDEYLDIHGNPVARGSDASHILPRTP